jgi:hypothetical protein
MLATQQFWLQITKNSKLANSNPSTEEDSHQIICSLVMGSGNN